MLKNKIAPLMIAVLAIGALIAAGASIASAKTSAKDPVQIGMPYFLYQEGAKIAGPCGNNAFVRNDGVVKLPNRYYQTKKLSTKFDGNVTEREFYDYRGFSSAYRFLYCKSHQYVYRYYGKDKVHRDKVCTNHVNEGGWIRIGCSFTSGWKAGWQKA